MTYKYTQGEGEGEYERECEYEYEYEYGVWEWVGWWSDGWSEVEADFTNRSIDTVFKPTILYSMVYDDV